MGTGMRMRTMLLMDMRGDIRFALAFNSNVDVQRGV